jgi:hypothetical protein
MKMLLASEPLFYLPDVFFSLTCRNVPYANQSTAVGIVTAASYGGTALAFGICPYIITHFGWPVSHYTLYSYIMRTHMRMNYLTVSKSVPVRIGLQVFVSRALYLSFSLVDLKLKLPACFTCIVGLLCLWGYGRCLAALLDSSPSQETADQVCCSFPCPSFCICEGSTLSRRLVI